MDTVIINDLQVEAVIGHYEHERQKAQPLRVDLELGVDFSAVFGSDNLAHTVDYADMSEQVTLFCKASQFCLLETLVGALMRHLFARYPIESVQITVYKPHALTNGLAAIRCYRHRSQLVPAQSDQQK